MSAYDYTKMLRRSQHAHTVSFHNFDLQPFKLRVSNPRTIAYAQFKTPFESPNLPGSWAFSILDFWTFENRPEARRGRGRFSEVVSGRLGPAPGGVQLPTGHFAVEVSHSSGI